MKAFCLFVILILSSTIGYTCPICNSATAKKVRASLFGSDLPYNLLVTITPFAIFALIVFLIYNGGRLPIFSKTKKLYEH
jgi:hypothetical protein